MKQIVAVLEAVNEDAFTSDLVAAATGLEIATASANLSALAEDGLIRRTKRDAIRIPDRRGRSMHIYRPILVKT